LWYEQDEDEDYGSYLARLTVSPEELRPLLTELERREALALEQAAAYIEAHPRWWQEPRFWHLVDTVEASMQSSRPRTGEGISLDDLRRLALGGRFIEALASRAAELDSIGNQYEGGE
jgi:hypothetical protein